MKKLIIKCLIIALPLYLMVVLCNYIYDPANLFNDKIIDDMATKMLNGQIIESPGDVGEGELLETLVRGMKQTPDTIVIGSSHIMYIPFEYEDYYVACLSGAYLGDYFAIAGVLEEYGHIPNRIVIGVDPWAFVGEDMSMRHTSLEQYKLSEIARTEGDGSTSVTRSRYSEIKDELTRYRELFSFSYFQSSVKNIKNGSRKFGANSEVKVSDSEDAGEIGKLLPNGRRVMSINNFKTVEENNASAINEINAKSMYQLYGFKDISDNNRRSFDLLIKHFTDLGCEVILYLPPWYPSIYEAFGKDDYEGVFAVEEYITSLGNDANIFVRGSYDPKVCGVTEEDYADCFHLKPSVMLETYKMENK